MDQLAKFLQAVGYRYVIGYPYLPVYLHLLVSALLPIYAGAHASLSRPSSAAKPSHKTKKQDDHDDKSEQGEQKMEWFGPVDALVLPLLAGLTLAGLYFLIKWLEDPLLLNKFLNWYFAVFGVWSVARMIKDILDVFTSLVFPKTYILDGNIQETDAKQGESELTPSPSVKQNSQAPERSAHARMLSKVTDAMWIHRELVSRQLDVRVYVHKVMQVQLKIGPQDVISILLAIVALLYFNLVDKPWWLTNLLGFGFAYSTLQIMSPATSWTGTLILGALFIYDIYFVFFTPLMVTVATQLDIPAKLLFPRPRRPSEDPAREALFMLGLGDIILPGMMIGFALRFDLYLFYLHKQTRRAVEHSESSKDAASDLPSKKTEDSKVIKATWYPATGGWGERFWTPKNDILRSKQFQGVLFSKTYFYASLIGYVLGMLCTLGVIDIYGQAQPALLYLVPGVLGSLWGTALVKGEIKTLWGFDEAEEEKEAEARKLKEGKGSVSKADGWLGFDWKITFPTVRAILNIADHPRPITQNGETNDQATDADTKDPQNTNSSADLSEDSNSPNSNHDVSTNTHSSDDSPPESTHSKANDSGRKKDKAKGVFTRDRKSELIFISINFSAPTPSKSTKMASIPEEATSSAPAEREISVKSEGRKNDDDMTMGLERRIEGMEVRHRADS